jgi:hypothetical protein
MPKFKLDWYSGASAEVEVFCPSAAGDTYKLKYKPPFRSTIRPPLEERHIGQEELNPINQQLDQLVTILDSRAAGCGTLPPAGPHDTALKDIVMLGKMLLTLIIPLYVQSDLYEGGLFLEFGMDETLLKYPWELMHDGEDFLCLKHSIGRFVNASPGIPSRQIPVSRMGSKLDKLSILLISVPNPQPRNNTVFKNLPFADTETEAICEVLAEQGNDIQLKTLIGKDATYNNVFSVLNETPYDIVHYNGHAQNNGLVLYDNNMKTGAINAFFKKTPPILCFINACETAKTTAWHERYNIFNLASAFLETGSYLLGSRWEINDKGAAEFAKKFYMSLLKEGKPLGSSVVDARKHCKETAPCNDFAWASYVLYGDPRICFRRV